MTGATSLPAIVVAKLTPQIFKRNDPNFKSRLWRLVLPKTLLLVLESNPKLSR